MAPPKKVTKRNNTRNPAAPLFKRLTRLFSGPLINYRAQFARQDRRTALDKYSTRFKSLSGEQFKVTQDNLSRNYNLLTSHAMRNQNRNERYIDFDQMEYMPEIASAMDIYADEMTTSNDYNPLLDIDTKNDEIKHILESLFYDMLNIEFNAFGWARTMCKYGDFFLYLDIDDKLGVKSVVGLPPQEIERLEGQDPTNPNYVQYQWNSAGMTFENWQVAHFRILGNDKHSPYGTSVLDPARRIWRQLVLIEDAMLAYRVVRAPERRVFKIDVGNIPPQDIEQYMEKVKTSMKRNQLINATTGRVDLRYNPLSVEEDYFIPMRGGVGSEITTLPGAASLNDIDDVKYIRDKLFSAIKIPQSYLTLGEGGEEDKSTLAQKDIRFARTIQRLQRSLLAELEKIAVVHLFTLGFRSDDLISFNLTLNNPSKLAELQELEQWRTKFDIASGATEGMFSRQWLSKNIFNMSDEEFLRNQREAFYDRAYQAELEAVSEMAAQEASAAMAGGMPPEEGMEGEAPIEGEEVPGDEGGGVFETPPAEGGGEEVPEGEESSLLAAPAAPAARRDDGSRDDTRQRHYRRTRGDKGHKYQPVKHLSDKRRRDKRGPTTRKSRSETRPWKTDSPRGVFPGSIGPNDLYEGAAPTYNKLETTFLENASAIRKLINELEEKELEKGSDENAAQ